MRFIVLLLFWTNSSITNAQDKLGELKLSGTILGKSIYQGGVEYDHSKIEPAPMPNYTICLIHWQSADSIPVFVKTVASDKNGNFEVCLPAGKYGFAMPTELDSLQPGQWLPAPTENWSGHNLVSSSWQLLTGGPIHLENKDIDGIKLIFHQTTSCMDCP